MSKKLSEGTHGDNRKHLGGLQNSNLESHHTPAESSFSNSKLTSGKAAAIKMNEFDHSKTASWDHNNGANDYRSKQRNLISKEGYDGYKKAFEMDVKDIQNKFSNKYDTQLGKARDYINSHEGKKNITNGLAIEKNQTKKPSIKKTKAVKPSKGFSSKPVNPTKFKNHGFKPNSNLQTIGKKSIKSASSIKNKVKSDTGGKALNTVAKGAQKTVVPQLAHIHIC
jgi:hypothetical protein